jgi:hypothetical protein
VGGWKQRKLAVTDLESKLKIDAKKAPRFWRQPGRAVRRLAAQENPRVRECRHEAVLAPRPAEDEIIILVTDIE